MPLVELRLAICRIPKKKSIQQHFWPDEFFPRFRWSYLTGGGCLEEISCLLPILLPSSVSFRHSPVNITATKLRKVLAAFHTAQDDEPTSMDATRSGSTSSASPASWAPYDVWPYATTDASRDGAATLDATAAGHGLPAANACEHATPAHATRDATHASWNATQGHDARRQHSCLVARCWSRHCECAGSMDGEQRGAAKRLVDSVFAA